VADITSEIPAGGCMPYRTIVADPPWPSIHQRSTYHRGKPERHYPTMPVKDIAALPAGDLAAPDAHLWIWGVNRLLDSAYDVARAWGFEPMTLVTWCKRGPGMGYYVRNNTEHVLLATRGEPMVPARAAISSWYEWPRGSHSRKPEEFYRLVQDVSPGPYLEMFARWSRPGWDAWGNRVRGDVEMDGWQPLPEATDDGALFDLFGCPAGTLREPPRG
jgi:N6-adenosine-specific RNA methylase IME4